MFDPIFYREFFELSKKKIRGVNFDDYFNIKGVSLRWFFHTILTSGTLPHAFIDTPRIRSSKPLNYYERLVLYISSYFFRWLLFVCENLKLYIRRNRPIVSKNVGKDKILFLTFTNHISYKKKKESFFRIGGLINNLKDDPLISPLIITADPVAKISINKLLRSNSTIYDYIDQDSKKKAKNLAKSLSFKWGTLGGIEKSNLFKFKSKRYWPKIRYTLEFLFSYTFIYYLYLYLFTLDKIIKSEKIKAVVVTSHSGFFEKCLFIVAKENSIPVIVVQHGLGHTILSKDYFLGNSKIAVFSEFYRKKWLSVGVKRSDVIVTGPVIFNGIYKFIDESLPEYLNRILIITQPFVEVGILKRKDYLDRLSDIIKQIRQFNNRSEIILKTHPKEKIWPYKVIRKRFKNIKINNLHDRFSFYSLIKSSDLVINFGSTAILEAMIIGRPVLTIKIIPDNDYFSKLIEENKASLLCDYNNLYKTLRLLKDKSILKTYKRNKDNFIKKICYKSDKDAAKRVVDIIKSQI